MDHFLEEIKQLEQAGIIQTTKQYLGSRKLNLPTPITSKEFKPGPFLIVMGFGLAITLLGAAVFRTFQPKSLTNSETGGVIVAYLGSFLLGVNMIRQFFHNKTMNFRIKIDHTAISIDDTMYKWSDIYETGILIKFAGKSGYKYLVIALNDMKTYACYDLTNFSNLSFGGFGKTLSMYIEYFKSA